MRIAVDGVVIDEGQLLLILYHDQQRGLHYGLPAGGVEPNETIQTAVRRELNEETKVKPPATGTRSWLCGGPHNPAPPMIRLRGA